METGLIIGADEFFGLTLCEYMMKEGIQVDISCPHAQTGQNKILIEERMMWLGRNDLIRVIDIEDGKESYDLIFIQTEEPNKRQVDIKARKGKYRIVLDGAEDDTLEHNEPVIVLPRMFGPWTLNQERRTYQEHSFYVEDVAEALVKWTIHADQRQEETHHLMVDRQTDEKQAEKKIAEWERHYSTFFDKNQE
ncbi:hypothetical protein BACPU_21200 [Bacillus pumilus]|nr:hypothetical protein BACPU_21200 [Bacillus pumilus]